MKTYQNWISRKSILTKILVLTLSFLHLAGHNMVAQALTGQTQDCVVINEIHYDPDVSTEFVEFIELHNTSNSDLDISGWAFTEGISYPFPQGTVLPAGGFVIVMEDVEAVEAKWGSGRTWTLIPASSLLGPFEGRLNNEGEDIILCDANGHEIDRVDYGIGFPWPVVGDPFPSNRPGAGHSIQLINPNFDNGIPSNWQPSAPTPCRANSVVYTNNPSPYFAEVCHNPQQPTSEQTTTVTARVADPNGLRDVFLVYQTVLPGHYIPARFPRTIAEMNADEDRMGPINSSYTSLINWTQVEMLDNGLGGDEISGDGIYSATIPAQMHRTLVRYRITAIDNLGQQITVPYHEDASLNFAYFVYNGVPEYEGFSKEILESLPVYHVISRWEDLHECMGWDNINRMSQGSPAWFVYNWYGTIVYDGIVYDNIRYRIRGGNGRYYPTSNPNSKRSMRFRFNRGHYFGAKDKDGNPYPTKWRTLTTTKGFDNRQTLTYALNEHINFHLFNQIGVSAPYSYYFHLRVIRGEDEAPDPWHGDFWGLGLAQETYDVRFLEAHYLEKGNLYKLINSTRDGKRQQRYQAHYAVTDASDYSNIENKLTGNSGADFIRHHVRLDRWYAYHALSQAIRHYDYWPSANKNAAWYFEPKYTPENNYLGQMWTLPWDTDASWGPTWNSGHDVIYNSIFPANGGGSDSSQTPGLQPDYYNAVREICDLLWQRDQIEPMLDYFASQIAEFVKADRLRWLNGPSDAGSYQGLSGAGMSGLDALVQDMKNFAFAGGSWPGGSVGAGGRAKFIDDLADGIENAYTPAKPAINYIGEPGYPVNNLRFQTSDFNDPQGSNTFEAIRWRIAKVEPDAEFGIFPEESACVLIHDQSQWNYFKGRSEPSSVEGLWRLTSYDDSQWSTGIAPIGYGEAFIATELSDMAQNYSTLYLRKTFELTDSDHFEKLIIDVLYDDGFNLWINGQIAAQGNVLSEELPYNTTINNRSDDYTFNRFTVSNPHKYLVPGTNIISMQVLNQSLSSSDLFVDVRISGKEASSEPIPDPNTPLDTDDIFNLEILPIWESDELMLFQETMPIPGGYLKPGETYRVRCKMKDNTGRWSHWSDPVQLITGDPVPSELAKYLRITEIMYNPSDPSQDDPNDNDEFEFIELANIGSDTIDISSLSFVEGITFDFIDGTLKFLEPSQYVLVVRNINAFVHRYGTPFLSRIAGEYEGKLSNEGEAIMLMDIWNGVIAEFNYDDAWYPATDGEGYSLVLDDLSAAPDTWGQKRMWRHSLVLGGSPCGPE